MDHESLGSMKALLHMPEMRDHLLLRDPNPLRQISRRVRPLKEHRPNFLPIRFHIPSTRPTFTTEPDERGECQGI